MKKGVSALALALSLSSVTWAGDLVLSQSAALYLTLSGEKAALWDSKTSLTISDTTVPRGLPVQGILTSKFGWRKSPVKRVRTRGRKGKSRVRVRFHKGLDLSAPAGTPVFATADGKVIFAGRRGDYGNLVIIEHASGQSTWYGHLSKIDVSEGDVIRRGVKVGEVGRTGRATGNHLHYEIRTEDGAINPIIYVEGGN